MGTEKLLKVHTAGYHFNMKLAWILVFSLAALANVTTGSPVGGVETRDESMEPGSPQFLKALYEMELAARDSNLIRMPRDVLYVQKSQVVDDSVRPPSNHVNWTKVGLGAGGTVLVLLSVYLVLKYLNFV